MNKQQNKKGIVLILALVVIIALITLAAAAVAKGNEFELLRLAKLGRINLVLSPQILGEFRGVISRPKFGFSREEVSRAVKQVLTVCSIILPSVRINVIKEDPEDNMVLECADSGKVDYIVSGDEHLLKLKKHKRIRILRTRELLEIVKED